MHDCLFDSSLANHKLSYISKCISVIYALDSVNEKIDVWTEADLLPFYQSDRTVQSTRIQITNPKNLPILKNSTDPKKNLPILIDSYVELLMYLIAT